MAHRMTNRPDWRQRGYDRIYDRNHGIVLRRQTTCWICGQPVDKTLTGPEGPSVDHVIPRRDGGTNQLDNLRLAHLRCNSARQAGERVKRRRPQPQHPGIIDPETA